MDGAGLAEVERPQSPAVLEDADQHAEGRGGGEQVHDGRDGGYQQAPEGHQQQQEPQGDDDRYEDQQPGGHHGSEVVVGGGHAAHVDVQPGGVLGGGDHAVAQLADQSAGCLGLGGGGGYHGEQRGVVAGDGRGDRGDAGLGLERARQPRERGRAGWGGGRAD